MAGILTYSGQAPSQIAMNNLLHRLFSGCGCLPTLTRIIHPDMELTAAGTVQDFHLIPLQSNPERT